MLFRSEVRAKVARHIGTCEGCALLFNLCMCPYDYSWDTESALQSATRSESLGESLANNRVESFERGDRATINLGEIGLTTDDCLAVDQDGAAAALTAVLLTSVTTATTLAVILEKSIYALRMAELMGAAMEWMAVMRMSYFRYVKRRSLALDVEADHYLTRILAPCAGRRRRPFVCFVKLDHPTPSFPNKWKPMTSWH